MPHHVSGSSPLRLLDSIVYNLAQREPQAANRREVLPKPPNPVRRGLWYVKMGLVRWLVQPYYDRLQGELAATHARLSQMEENLRTSIDAVNRPFECYVIGDKAVQQTMSDGR
jgi:hypothetical protein